MEISIKKKMLNSIFSPIFSSHALYLYIFQSTHCANCSLAFRCGIMGCVLLSRWPQLLHVSADDSVQDRDHGCLVIVCFSAPTV